MNYANHNKVTSSIFMSSNKPNFFISFFFDFLFVYIKVSKDSSVKNYQNNKESLQKKAC